MLNRINVSFGIYTIILIYYTLRPIDSSDAVVTYLDVIFTNVFVFTDIFINIFMYIPWGYLMMLLLMENTDIGSLCPWFLVSTAVGLSTSIEALQFFIPTRYPSVLDILANTTGAIIGGLLALIAYYFMVRMLLPKKYLGPI